MQLGRYLNRFGNLMLIFKLLLSLIEIFTSGKVEDRVNTMKVWFASNAIATLGDKYQLA